MNFENMFIMQGMLFALMLIGLLLKRTGLITDGNRGLLSGLVVNVTLPCSIIKSFEMEFDMEILRSCLAILLVALAIQVGAYILSLVLYPGLEPRHKKVLQYATICSNAGILGNPIAEGIYGALGLLYASIYLIPQRIFMWSYGLSMFTTVSGREVVKKIITHPCIIAVALGLVVMCLYTNGIYIPSALDDTIGQIGGCVTALSMMLIGAILSDVALKEMLNRTALVYSFYRLLLIPALVGLILWMLPLDILSIKVSILLTAMPVASTSAMLAEKYGRDYKFASELIMTSTILSLFTIPVVATALEWIF